MSNVLIVRFFLYLSVYILYHNMNLIASKTIKKAIHPTTYRSGRILADLVKNKFLVCLMLPRI